MTFMERIVGKKSGEEMNIYIVSRRVDRKKLEHEY